MKGIMFNSSRQEELKRGNYRESRQPTVGHNLREKSFYSDTRNQI